MNILQLLPCAADTLCAILQKLERHSVSHPAKEETPRLYSSWRSHPVGRGPPLAFESEGRSKRRSGVQPGAAFVIHGTVCPGIFVHPMHKTLGVKFFVASLATLFVLSPDEF